MTGIPALFAIISCYGTPKTWPVMLIPADAKERRLTG
jgi:hypothetical protein